MSNYSKSTNFATKDNLTPGDPLKIVRGTEIDTEFNNIATAIATKTDNSSAAITGGTINATTIGATTASTGAFTTLAASGAVTLSGGTANGVPYLNGSKVVTSGSAFTFDGANIIVNATTPAYFTGTSNLAQVSINRSPSTGAIFNASQSAAYLNIDGASGGSSFQFVVASAANTQPSEQMRLTSTGLGIGTSSPTEKLTVNGNIKLGTSGTTYIYGPSTTGRSFLSNSDSTAYIGIYGSSYGSSLDSVISFVAGTSNSMTYNASGNLGLGVTPSAWASTSKAIQLGTIGFLENNSNDSQYMGRNAYRASGGWTYSTSSFAQLFGMEASGQYAWYNAAVGTAGNAITFTQAMTLDASGNLLVGTTSAVGRFTLENSSTTTEITLRSTGGVGTNNRARIIAGYESGGSDYGGYLAFNTTGTSNANTEAARIDSSGNLLVGTTSLGSTAVGFGINGDSGSSSKGACISVINSSVNGNTTYEAYSLSASAYRFYVGMGGTVYATSTTITAISDQRLKENIRDLDEGLATVMALKPRKFDWKAGKGADIKNARGFIAQEFEQVLPDMIEEWRDPAPEGEEPYKAINANLIPTLVKALQEQQAIIESLKARLDAANL